MVRVRYGLMRTFTVSGALAVALLVLGSGPARAQVASPLQSGHYAPGLVNIRDFAAPPPGLFVYDMVIFGPQLGLVFRF
jgi:hypothetical protein